MTPAFLGQPVETASSYVLPFSYPAVASLAEMSDAQFSTLEAAQTDTTLYKQNARTLRTIGAEHVKRGIPADILQEAEKHAPSLANSLLRFSSVMLRHQPVGSLDTSKLVQLAMPASDAAFEFEASRAYRRRGNAARLRKLNIAIVGDFNYQIRRDHPSYTGKLSRLVQIVSDACFIAGMNCSVVGARGHLVGAKAPEGIDKPCTALATLKTPGEQMSGFNFALITNENLFIRGYAAAFSLGRAQFPNDTTVQSMTAQGSRNGTGGIDYAREVLKSDFIIGIGNFFDVAKPEVLLRPSQSVEQMIAAIAARLDQEE